MFWKSNKVNRAITIDEIFSVFRARFNKNHTFSGEAHNFWECLYVISGQVCVTADNRVYILEENDIIFHKPLEFHKFTITGNSDAELFTFSYSLSGSLAPYFNEKVFKLSPEQRDVLSKLYLYCESKSKGTSTNDYQKYLPAFDENPLYSQTVATHIIQLLLMLGDYSTELNATTESDAGEFAKAVDYMNSNIDRNVLISDISEHMKTSPSTIKRIFIKYAGLSVHKYFLKLKIKTATNLLEMGMPVSEVSEKLGFSSQGYFSGRYKKETGITPSEIKQKSHNITPE